jgi:fatty-acyl-CoA synthase
MDRKPRRIKMTERFPIRGVEDIERLERVPLAERLPAQNTYELIRRGARLDPKKVALYFIPRGEDYDKPLAISYEQLWGRINQTANLFYDLGLRPGEVVSILLPNLPQTHFALWGGEAAGIANPINPFLGADQIKEIMRTAKAKILVALGPQPGVDIWEKVERIRKELKLEAVLQVGGPGDEKEGVYSFDELVGKYDPTKLTSRREIGPDEIASLFHTGGTTGLPKLAKHTHLNEVYDAWAIAVMGDFSEKEVLLCGLPLFHVNGVIITGLTPFAFGATVVLLSPAGYRDRAIIQNFFKIIERYRATFFSAVPTVYAALLQVPLAGEDLSSLRYAICGAAPMPVELFREFERRTGVKILEGYGLTEGACASSVNPRDGERRVGSIGIRLPYQEMKTVIVDDQGRYVRDCRTDEIGLVVIKGPNVFPGYLQEEHNRGIWVAPGWLNTGDLGRQDKDGYFWLTGRAKDLIIRGGHNIDPATIEEPLYRHPAVALAAAVGRPDPYAGEVPMAYIVLKEGAKATEEELLEYCKRNIGEPMAVPKEIVFLERMPMTLVGKIFKPELRWDAVRRVYQRELEALEAEGLAEKVEVKVGEHRVYGTLAEIMVKPKRGVDREQLERRVSELLKGYTIRYELKLI